MKGEKNMSYRNEFNQVSTDFNWTFWKVFWWIFGVSIVVGLLGYAMGWFTETANVAKDEFGAKAALEKYEWFKDQYQRIEKTKADIATYEERVKSVDTQYSEYGNKAKWPADIRIQYNHAKQIARDDLTAIVSNYNNLVKEYNAASSKFNWVPFKTESNKPKETMEEYFIPPSL
jgi:hypothetical protein